MPPVLISKGPGSLPQKRVAIMSHVYKWSLVLRLRLHCFQMLFSYAWWLMRSQYSRWILSVNCWLIYGHLSTSSRNFPLVRQSQYLWKASVTWQGFVLWFLTKTYAVQVWNNLDPFGAVLLIMHSSCLKKVLCARVNVTAKEKKSQTSWLLNCANWYFLLLKSDDLWNKSLRQTNDILNTLVF